MAPNTPDPEPAPDSPTMPTEHGPARVQSEILNQIARRQRSPTPGPGGEPGTPAAKRYRNDGEIARGGMGAIMKVWDVDLRRALAMKVILGGDHPAPDGSTPDARLDRFLEEAQITGQLDHPGVVPVHELGVDDDGRVYFTMRLVRGRDFASVITLARDGREGWTRTRALDALLRVCETMAYAHAKSVVHRDLKPENIMVGAFGETYVMDWGLARVLGQPDSEAQRRKILGASSASIVHTARRDGETDGSSLTEEGAIMGTPFYMPPEQAAGELEHIGPQSDVYAAGAMLYHLLTGKRPYDELRGQPSYVVVRAVLAGPPRDLHGLDRTIPAELGAICHRAMARAAADRYPSMIEMAADLRAYLESRVVKAYRTGALVEFRKWISRNRAAFAALSALVLVSIAGLASFGWMQHEKAAAITAAQLRTQEARDDALRNLAQAKEQGYVANVTAANAGLAAGEILEAKRHLVACAPELRGFEWHHLSLRADASIAALLGHEGSVTDLAFAADGRRLVSGGVDGQVRIWDLDARTVLQTLDTGGGHESGSAVAFTAGGDRVTAFGRRRDAKIQVWTTASGNLESRLPLDPSAVYAIAIAPDAATAAIGAPDHSIRLIETRSGRSLGALVGHGATVRALAFSRDGQRLVSGGEDRSVRVWDVAARAGQASSPQFATTVHSVAFAPGGDEVIAGLEDGAILRLGAADGVELARLLGHAGAVYGLAFDTDGGRLASASFDKTVRQWRMPSGEALAVMLGHDHPVRTVTYSPDGTRLASGSEDASIRLWDATRQGAVSVHRGPDEYLTAVAISADGAHIVIGAAWPGTIEVVAAANMQVEKRVRGPEDSVSALAYAPTGQVFAAGFEEECSVRILDPATGELGAPFLGHEASVTAIAFRRDGARFASGSADQSVRLWDVATAKAVGTPLRHDAPVSSLAWTADGKRLATSAQDGSARIFDADSGALLTTFAGDGVSLHALAFGAEGNTLALGRGDGQVRIVDAATGRAIATLTGHDQRVTALAFTVDGARLATSSLDGTVRVWGVASARLLLTLRGHTAAVTGVAWSSDGSRLVSTSHDGTLRVWQTAAAGE